MYVELGAVMLLLNVGYSECGVLPSLVALFSGKTIRNYTVTNTSGQLKMFTRESQGPGEPS